MLFFQIFPDEHHAKLTSRKPQQIQMARPPSSAPAADAGPDGINSRMMPKYRTIRSLACRFVGLRQMHNASTPRCARSPMHMVLARRSHPPCGSLPAWRRQTRRWRWPAGSAFPAAESPRGTAAAPSPSTTSCRQWSVHLPEALPHFFGAVSAAQRHAVPDNAKSALPVAIHQVGAEQHDIAGLGVGKHFAPEQIGIGVLQAAGQRKEHGGEKGFGHLPVMTCFHTYTLFTHPIIMHFCGAVDISFTCRICMRHAELQNRVQSAGRSHKPSQGHRQRQAFCGVGQGSVTTRCPHRRRCGRRPRGCGGTCFPPRRNTCRPGTR